MGRYQIPYKKSGDDKTKNDEDGPRVMKAKLVNRAGLVGGMVQIAPVGVRKNGERPQKRQQHHKKNQEDR